VPQPAEIDVVSTYEFTVVFKARSTKRVDISSMRDELLNAIPRKVIQPYVGIEVRTTAQCVRCGDLYAMHDIGKVCPHCKARAEAEEDRLYWEKVRAKGGQQP